jgi:hypothetical protein
MSNTTIQKEGMLTMKRFQTMLIAAPLAVAILAAATMQPARADGAASTRNIILGAAALVAGVAIESNAAHKHQLANTVQGYLPNGGVVYEDGHVVLPNGQVYYPGNYGQTIACSNQACYVSGGNGNSPYYGYAPYYGSGNAPYYGYAATVQRDNDDHRDANASYNNNRYAWVRSRTER